MADSVRHVDEEVVRRIHSSNHSGHLHKGHGIVAATSSIPTKFQTIVTDNGDKKGFLSQSKRFGSFSDQNENPGPGKYTSHKSMNNNSTSFSKRGTGGFASKSKRKFKYDIPSGPGPGIYSLPGLLSTRKDFNAANNSRTFQQPIAEKVVKEDWRPSPNQYDIAKVKYGKANNVSANAAFKSKSLREVINTKESQHVPAPGHYNVRDDICHDSVKIPVSSFKSTSVRRMAPDPPPFPGPGTYKPWEEIDDDVIRQLLPRKHYLCISAPAMPLPGAAPSPGPGAYNLKSNFTTNKHYMSGANFVSTSSRWTGAATKVDLPGPAHYKPVHTGKQSFIYNVQGRWI
ncbi:O(6)-methylguanine-induced apoptosis 2-like [Liolophura sinensis]|uniref:O(6)-methylguanine-induced apoptosis 2-like n=1 Tax=Liolophura sinensis TaxID=3198878 RepID=UPI003157F307